MGPPVALEHRAALRNPPETAARLVALENLRRSVAGLVIGDDDEVDPGAQVVCDLGVDDVRLVPGHDGRDHSHRSVTRIAGGSSPGVSRML